MLTVLVMSPVKGEYVVTQVWYVKNGDIVGFSKKGGKVGPAIFDTTWKSLPDIVRTRNREVVQSIMITSPSEEYALSLLGKDYKPE